MGSRRCCCGEEPPCPPCCVNGQPNPLRPPPPICPPCEPCHPITQVGCASGCTASQVPLRFLATVSGFNLGTNGQTCCLDANGTYVLTNNAFGRGLCTWSSPGKFICPGSQQFAFSIEVRLSFTGGQVKMRCIVSATGAGQGNTAFGWDVTETVGAAVMDCTNITHTFENMPRIGNFTDGLGVQCKKTVGEVSVHIAPT